MIEIKSKTHVVRLFAEKLTPIRDLFTPVYYANYKGDKSKISFFYTVGIGDSAVSDLKLSMDELFSLMKSNTRNEIKRAIKEGISFEYGDDYDSFVPFYNSFCESKRLHDRTDLTRLQKYNAGDNRVVITKALYGGQVLTMHATVMNKIEKMAFLLFSCSQRLDKDVDKKMIGWGNRYLHYKDFEYLKNEGIELYEWSGIVTDPNDERYSIAQFKLSFGGKPTKTVVIRSPLFMLLSNIRPLVERFRK